MRCAVPRFSEGAVATVRYAGDRRDVLVGTPCICRIEIFASWSCVLEKRELSKTEFELIDEGLKALLDSGPDPVVAEKVAAVAGCRRRAISGCSGVWLPPPKYRNKEACNQDNYPDADLYPVLDRRRISMSNPIRPPV
jgi:hypothetical protein